MTDIELHLRFPSDKSLKRLEEISREHADPDVRLIAEVLANVSESLSTIAEDFLPRAFPGADGDRPSLPGEP